MQNAFSARADEFLNHLRFQKHYSEHTIISYRNDLDGFSVFLQKQFPDTSPEAVRSIFIRSWLAEMKEQKISSRTIGRKLSALRSFYKYLLKNELIKSSPVTGLTAPKMAKRLPQFVEEEATHNLFTGLFFPDDFVGRTEELMLSLLYQAGLRKAELINLRDYHIDYHNSTIKVLGKGNKERILPINPALTASLKNYIAEKKIAGLGNELQHLFVSEKGKPFDPRAVYSIVKKYLKHVTTTEKKSPHILRHSFATHLMNNGADLNAVKELLGHSSLAATQVYTHNSIEKLKDVYKKAHPKA